MSKRSGAFDEDAGEKDNKRVKISRSSVRQSLQALSEPLEHEVSAGTFALPSPPGPTETSFLPVPVNLEPMEGVELPHPDQESCLMLTPEPCQKTVSDPEQRHFSDTSTSSKSTTCRTTKDTTNISLVSTVPALSSNPLQAPLPPTQNLDIAESCVAGPSSDLVFEQTASLHTPEPLTFEEVSGRIHNAFLSNASEDDLDSDDEESLDLEQFKHQFQELLYDGAQITVLESLISVLTYAHSEKLSVVALGGLLKLMSLHLPKPNLFHDSAYLFLNSLNCGEKTEIIFYYCNLCYRPRESSGDLCTVCIDPLRKVEYFVHLPIRHQLTRLLSRKEILDAIICYKDNRVKICNENIEDVTDSQSYKNYHDGSPKISLQWNTDGVSPFNSSTYSMWPFFLVINELPPKLRYRPENVILAGLWGSKNKPSPNVFLRPLFEETEILRNDGLTIKSDESEINFKVVPVCGTCDSPAKASFFNINSHSGKYFCPKCLIEGEKSERTMNVLVFPHQDILEPRTKDNYVEHCRQATLQKDTEKGVKGPSILSYIVPDMLSSTSIDSMHCVYMGVAKQVLHLTFDLLYSDAPFSLYSKLVEANKLLLSVKLPHFVQRELVPFDKLSFWKASVLRNFLLYVALPLFKKIMKPQYFEHFKLLVMGVSLCNSQSVSAADLQEADVLLRQFVKDFEILYGIRYMSSNLHQLRHLAASVFESGPLWISNCFPFENLNGKLLSLVHGSKDLILQILRNLNVLTQLPLQIKKLPIGPVKTFCEKLTHKYRRLKKNDEINFNSFSVGKYIAHEEEMLQGKDVFLFTRLYQSELLYVSEMYGRGSRVSSYVKYQYIGYNYFGRIERFFKDSTLQCGAFCSDTCICSQFFAVIQMFHVEPAYVNACHKCHVYRCSIAEGHVHILHVSCLSTICWHVVIENDAYICEPLNSFELE